jgi:hypothetical protein
MKRSILDKRVAQYSTVRSEIMERMEMALAMTARVTYLPY